MILQRKKDLKALLTGLRILQEFFVMLFFYVLQGRRFSLALGSGHPVINHVGSMRGWGRGRGVNAVITYDNRAVNESHEYCES